MLGYHCVVLSDDAVLFGNQSCVVIYRPEGGVNVIVKCEPARIVSESINLRCENVSERRSAYIVATGVESVPKTVAEVERASPMIYNFMSVRQIVHTISVVVRTTVPESGRPVERHRVAMARVYPLYIAVCIHPD